jgi:hypothetical protein
MRCTFTAGIPLRGAVSHGEFFFYKHCFAGQPIISAYRYANNLECAGCCLVPNTAQDIRGIVRSSSVAACQTIIFHLLDSYHIATKVMHNRPMLVLDYNKFNSLAEIPSITSKSFRSHNKGLPMVARSKLRNTITMFKHFHQRREHKEAAWLAWQHKYRKTDLTRGWSL